MPRTSASVNVQRLTVMALLAAMLVLFAVPPLGSIAIGPASITLSHLPVIIALLSEGLWPGVAMSVLMGLISLLRAFTSPTGPMDYLFINPVISVLPRVAIPFAAWGAYSLLKKIKPNHRLLAWGAAGLAGSMANTVAVLGMLALLSGQAVANILSIEIGAVMGILGGLVVTNGLPEAFVLMILTPVLMHAISMARRRRS